jgi:hypothetical protein
VTQVFVAGAGNLMRSMITGRFRVPPETARTPFAEPPDA